LTYARALARSFGARLHVLHLTENLFLRPTGCDPHAVRAAVLRTLEERLTADDRTHLHAQVVVETSDEPADAIIQYARSANIDLIVMGTHGRSGLSHLLVGSVAERVVRTAPCPVLTVRHPEHEFVVPDATPHEAALASRADQANLTIERRGPAFAQGTSMSFGPAGAKDAKKTSAGSVTRTRS
jgi:nucleotide-binding universal stress UspA family protein